MKILKIVGRLIWWSVFWVVVFGALWCCWIYQQIRKGEMRDYAWSASAIAVFGAAEYNGRPSPVLRARLEHALDLYKEGLAPVIVTLGGGSDPQFSEGEVGRDYLLAHGVQDRHIIAETDSQNTEQSVQALAKIAAANHFQRIIVVSDGTHLFRIRELCLAQGLDVLPSPRYVGKPIDSWEQVQRYAHEIASYALWRLHLH